MWKQTDSKEPQAPLQSQAAAASQRNPLTPPKERALIGPTLLIKGDLSGEEDLLIEGRIEGKIELKKHNVTVGKNGRVKADVFGKVVSIEGEVHGNLHAEDQLILRQTSTVRGNIAAPRVVLEDGANFKGSIDMSPKEASPREQPSPTVSLLSPAGGKT